MTTAYKSHHSGDSSVAKLTAIPGFPTNGKGPKRNVKAGQIIEVGFL